MLSLVYTDDLMCLVCRRLSHLKLKWRSEAQRIPWQRVIWCFLCLVQERGVWSASCAASDCHVCVRPPLPQSLRTLNASGRRAVNVRVSPPRQLTKQIRAPRKRLMHVVKRVEIRDACKQQCSEAQTFISVVLLHVSVMFACWCICHLNKHLLCK